MNFFFLGILLYVEKCSKKIRADLQRGVKKKIKIYIHSCALGARLESTGEPEVWVLRHFTVQ